MAIAQRALRQFGSQGGWGKSLGDGLFEFRVLRSLAAIVTTKTQPSAALPTAEAPSPRDRGHER